MEGFQVHSAELALVDIEMQPPIFLPSAKNVTFPEVDVVATSVFADLKIAVLKPEPTETEMLGPEAAAIEKLRMGRRPFPLNL